MFNNKKCQAINSHKKHIGINSKKMRDLMEIWIQRKNISMKKCCDNKGS